MKALFFTSIACLFILAILVGWSKYDSNRISVKITETRDTYNFESSYNKSQTWKVQNYINQCMKPNEVFRSDHDFVDVTTAFSDKTDFHLKASPGEVEIAYNKRAHSYAAYTRMKNMYAGISAIVGGK